MIVQTDEQREQGIEREVQRRVANALEEAPSLLKTAVREGVRAVIDDPEIQRRFWENGYREFEKHASANLAQAIGRRVILFVVTAAVGMALAWSWIVGRPDR
jgi:hypothetical protein